MYKHILLPTDGTDRSERAISAGIKLAKAVGARVTGICVSEATYIGSVDDSQHPLASSNLASFAQLAEAAGLSFDCVSIVGDSPQDSIVRFAKDHDCDLIIMGTHGRSRIGKLFLGSVAATVLSECDTPVLLYR